MNKLRRLWLLLASLLFPAIATAQNVNPPSHNQSHRDLGGFDVANAQEMMTERLRDLQELHQLQDKVQELLKDEQFRKQMEKFPKEELRRLQEKLLNGQGLSQNPAWNQLLNKAAEGNKLEQKQIDILKRWAKRAEQKPSVIESGKRMLDNPAETSPAPPRIPPPGSATPPPPPERPTEPTPSMLDRLQEDSMKWVMENFEGLSGDILQALAEIGNESNTPLAEILRSVPKSDFSGLNINEHPLIPALQTGTLSHYLSKAGDFVGRHNAVWDKVGTLFNKTSLPSLPNIGGPSASMHAPSAAENGGWLPVVLSCLLLGLIVLFLCIRGLGSKGRAGSDEDAEWRLGSWPVAPEDVSTRQDVIRTFEYLTLLCFGPAAAVCHHHQLAERLAQKDSGNPARRQAAELLAWLYEQARYAPVGEALSPEQISEARQALRSLAGVTTA